MEAGSVTIFVSSGFKMNKVREAYGQTIQQIVNRVAGKEMEIVWQIKDDEASAAPLLNAEEDSPVQSPSETDISKTWQLGLKSQLVAHANAGIIYTYGNSESAPYSEQFYVGGANSIRAFAVRSIGPGSYTTDVSRLSYLDQTGDIKLQFNLEYRFNLFGGLYGAAFIDAGNVWALRDDGYRHGAKFELKNALKEMALGTGVGIRYDLDFLVLRLDWGIGLHVPYDTGKSGFYNIPRFKDGQAIHLAVGYPF